MKVCYRAGTVTQENGIAHIQTNAVEIRVLFLTDDRTGTRLPTALP